MKTVVYQSYRTVDVPPWIERCMATVRAWSKLRGFDYSFFDDEMFDRVPGWYREKTKASIWLMSDLARLILARDFLAGRYDRTIWVDADIVIFDPDRFDIDVDEEYAFCREVWVRRIDEKNFAVRNHTNNAISVFTTNNSFLEFYIHACERIVANLGAKFSGLEVGTPFLTLLDKHLHFRTLPDVGQLTPALCSDIAAGGGEMTRVYIDNMGVPIRAANLCGSMANREFFGVVVTDEVIEGVVDRLLRTKGYVINGRLAG